MFGLLVAVIKSIHSKRLQIKMIKIPAVYFDISEPVLNMYYVFNIGLYEWGNTYYDECAVWFLNLNYLWNIEATGLPLVTE